MPSRRGEAQLRVVPVRELPGPGVYGRTTSAKPASTTAWKAARSGCDTCVLVANTAMSQTSSSRGAMFQSPHSAICVPGSAASQPAPATRSASSQRSLYCRCGSARLRPLGT